MAEPVGGVFASWLESLASDSNTAAAAQSGPEPEPPCSESACARVPGPDAGPAGGEARLCLTAAGLRPGSQAGP